MTQRGRPELGGGRRVPRLYHSVAVLLPDGTVITADQSGARRRRAASSSSIRRICLEGLGR